MLTGLNGIINVLKPPGMTSSNVVVFLRKNLKIEKAGHTGTLDPEAAGVLPICFGRATRISDYIMHRDKVYRCEMKLGITTDTADMTGSILSRSDNLPGLDRITEVLKSYLGDSEQIPPMHSAIKVNGSKLYELARKGVELDIPPRKIHIGRIDILDYRSPDSLLVEIECSKGTYIRSLCRDIGRDLGCGAAMAFLLRTRTGDFTVENTYTLNEIIDSSNRGMLDRIIIPVEKALKGIMPSVTLKDECINRIKHGNQVGASNITDSEGSIRPDEAIAVYCGATFCGIGMLEVNENGGTIKMKNVLL